MLHERHSLLGKRKITKVDIKLGMNEQDKIDLIHLKRTQFMKKVVTIITKPSFLKGESNSKLWVTDILHKASHIFFVFTRFHLASSSWLLLTGNAKLFTTYYDLVLVPTLDENFPTQKDMFMISYKAGTWSWMLTAFFYLSKPSIFVFVFFPNSFLRMRNVQNK